MFTRKETVQDICDSMTTRLKVISDRESAEETRIGLNIAKAEIEIEAMEERCKLAGNNAKQANTVISKVQAFFTAE